MCSSDLTKNIIYARYLVAEYGQNGDKPKRRQTITATAEIKMFLYLITLVLPLLLLLYRIAKTWWKSNQTIGEFLQWPNANLLRFVWPLLSIIDR